MRSRVVAFGISTDMCVSTHRAGRRHLGWRMILPADACACFDLRDADGSVIDADVIQRAHLARCARSSPRSRTWMPDRQWADRGEPCGRGALRHNSPFSRSRRHFCIGRDHVVAATRISLPGLQSMMSPKIFLSRRAAHRVPASRLGCIVAAAALAPPRAIGIARARADADFDLPPGTRR